MESTKPYAVQPAKPYIADPDQHIVEPPDFWTSRVPAKYKHLAPRVADFPAGGQIWIYDGDQTLWPIGLEATAGRNYSEYALVGPTYETIRPGCFDPKARLRDMDIDGIDAAVLFPSVGMKIRTARAIKDPEYGMALLRAYNDGIWEWCQEGDTRRLVPLGLINGFGIDYATDELERLLKKGFKGVNLQAYPSGGDTPSAADDKFWALCQEAGAIVNIHVNLSLGSAASDMAFPKVENAWEPEKARQVLKGMSTRVTLARTPAGIMKAIWEITMTGVFHRYPRLQVLGVETGVGWLPFILEQIDDTWKRHRFWSNATVYPMQPSEYIRRNFKATLQVDRAGVLQRHLIGVDNIMWSSDYPHMGMDWPNSRWVIDMQFQGVPEEEKARMTGGTCRQIYGL